MARDLITGEEVPAPGEPPAAPAGQDLFAQPAAAVAPSITPPPVSPESPVPAPVVPPDMPTMAQADVTGGMGQADLRDPDEIIRRAQMPFIPLGRTRGGALTFAIPQPVLDTAQTVQRLLAGAEPTGEDVVNLMGASPVTAGMRAGRPAVQAGIEAVGEATSDVARRTAARVQVADAFNIDPKNLPDTSTIKARAQDAYRRLDDAGLTLRPETYNRFVGQAVADVNKAQFIPDVHRDINSLLVRLQNRVDSGAPITVSELDALRQVARDIALGNNAKEARLANIVIERIDDTIDGLGRADLVGNRSGSRQAIQSLKEGRFFWRQFRKAEIIDDIIERAHNAAGANFTQAGLETALRQKFRQLLDNRKRMRPFTASERAAIQRLVRGGKAENFLRWAGKFAPTGVIPAAGTGFLTGSLLGLPAEATAVAFMGGVGARRAAEALARRNVGRVQREIRGALPGLAPGGTGFGAP